MLYDFLNKNTGEYVQLEMMMADREPYLEANPNMEQVIIHCGFLGDSVKLGITKPDGAFINKIERMQHGIPHNKIHSRYTQNIREI